MVLLAADKTIIFRHPAGIFARIPQQAAFASRIQSDHGITHGGVRAPAARMLALAGRRDSLSLTGRLPGASVSGRRGEVIELA